MVLTAKKVRDARPDSKAFIEWDDDPVGLGLRVWPSGKKVFILNYRVDGRSRRMNLGTVKKLSLEQARDVAREAMRGIRVGIDPLELRNARKALPTVSEGLDQYLAQYIPARQAKGRMAESTVLEYSRQIERNIRPKIGNKRIRDVTKGDIEKVLRPLPPIMANRVCALLSALFNQFENWEYRPQHTNPARGIERSVEDARDRTLSETELSALGKALDTSGAVNPSAILAIRLAAVTGLRIGEVLNIRWEDIDFEGRILILPKAKTGRRVHTLPTAALALLVNTPHQGEYAVSGRYPNLPMSYNFVYKNWAEVCKNAGIKGVRLHDLRRTIMTEAAALGVGTHLLRDMLGHKTTQVADRYARQARAPLVELRERMGAGMAAKMAGASGEPKGEVEYLGKKNAGK